MSRRVAMVALSLLIVLATPYTYYAAVFAGRELLGSVGIALPAVYFFDPGTPGVTVTTENYGTVAYVDVSVPAPELELVKRSAIFYDTFDTNPIAAGRVQAITCPRSWSWDSTARALRISAGSRSSAEYDYECILVANVDISSYAQAGRTIYVAALAWRSGYTRLPTIRVETVYIDTAAARFYTSGFRSSIQTGRTGDHLYSEVTYVSGGARGIVDSRDLGTSLTLEYQYMSYVASSADFASWYIYHWNETVLASGTVPEGSRFYPNRAGVGYWVDTTGVRGYTYFDNLVITVDSPPWLVRVVNLLPGWSVVLKNSTGYVISAATAGPDGAADLVVSPRRVDLAVQPNYRDGFIIPGGTLEVYDSGGRLVVSRTFDYVIGGDTYELRLPSFPVLGVATSVVGQTFEAKLAVTSISGCEDTYLELYLVNTTGATSTPARVYLGLVDPWETGAIQMTGGPDGVAGYVYARVYLPTGASCSVSAYFTYSFSGWATTGINMVSVTFHRP